MASASKVFSNVTSDAAKAVEGAGLVVFCTPVGAMAELAKKIQPAIASHAVVTDAGSVKSSVEKVLGPLFGGRFVGSHPMAGSEKSGLGAATPDLFRGATCILTPSPESETDAISTVSDLWQSVGCRTTSMSAKNHDKLIARASHLPHAIASALSSAVTKKCPEALAVTGPGYRDTTRVAGGPAGMWAEIFLENRSDVLQALTEFDASLAEFRDLLHSGSRENLEAFLRQSQPAQEPKD